MTPSMPKPAEMPKASSINVDSKGGKSSVSDLSGTTTKETAKPKPEMPKPALPVVEAPTARSPSKVERYVPPTAPKSAGPMINYDQKTPAPLPTIKEVESAKPLAAESVIKGVIRQNATGAPLDGNTVRRAIEDVSRGAATQVSIDEKAGRQLTVSMTCATQSDWDRLFAKIKSLPEVAGYSVIYNVSISSKARSSSSISPPMMGIIRTSATAAPVEVDVVKTCIEKACKRHGEDIEVRTTGKQQVTIGMKVRTAADWESLHRQIKDLPEVGGYAVIYNVSVK
jgi:hypothetical protein